MKKLKLLVTSLLLLTTASVFGDNVTVSVPEIEPGKTFDISVSLENTSEVAGYQMNLYLPEGFSLYYDADEDDYLYSLSERHTRRHVISIEDATDGSTLFAVYSTKSGDKLTGTSGEIFTITLFCDESVTESKQASFKLVTISDTNGATTDLADVTFDLTLKQAVVPVTVTATSVSRVYGEANPVFEYTSEGAELIGVPEITCEATATSPVGEYPIVISKGSVTNEGATYVNGVLTITAAPLTIKGGMYTMKQGEELPTFTATYEGFKNDETEDVLTTKPTLSTTATSASEPGEYKVTVSGAAAQNYEISYVPGTLTITNADPVTVTAKSYTIAYGDVLPTFEYTSEGATLSGVPSITCEATATSPVGEYPIIISKGSVTNYNDTYVNGKLTIMKAPLTIKGGTYTMKQGEELPTFTATYEGFKNGETEDVLTTKPTLSTTATSASDPGDYEVTVSGAEAQNYAISYVPGTLTIGAADAVTVTATSYTIKYGDAIPEFAYTSEGATLEGTPSITCEATATSPVGEYAIVITKGSVTNYNDHYVNGTLTIEKAPLTISGGTYTMKQGEELPTFVASYDGFKNEETEDVLTTKPTLTTTATSASEPGEYAVTVSGAEAQNYAISYVPGTLTITVSDGIGLTPDSSPTGEGNYYTLDGQKLNGKPTQKGVYIQNGKKIIVK